MRLEAINTITMKIAGLMPVISDQDSMINPSWDQLCSISDHPLKYADNDYNPMWNDYGNRLVLLALATRKYCDWVLWLDDDELIEPAIQHEKLHQCLRSEIKAAQERDCIAVSFQRCDMWDKTHWRSDGVWGQKRKVVLQRNPLTGDFVHWRGSHTQRLHVLPLQVGDIFGSPLKIYHYGWNSIGKRLAARAKYARQDPNNVFQAQGYDYLVDESGIELTEV